MNYLIMPKKWNIKWHNSLAIKLHKMFLKSFEFISVWLVVLSISLLPTISDKKPWTSPTSIWGKSIPSPFQEGKVSTTSPLYEIEQVLHFLRKEKMLVFKFCILLFWNFRLSLELFLPCMDQEFKLSLPFKDSSEKKSFQKWIFNLTTLILILLKERAIIIFVHKVNIENILFMSKFLNF